MFLVTLVSRQGGLEYVSKDGRTSMEEGGPGGHFPDTGCTDLRPTGRLGCTTDSCFPDLPVLCWGVARGRVAEAGRNHRDRDRVREGLSGVLANAVLSSGCLTGLAALDNPISP